MREVKFRAWNGKRMQLMGLNGFCDFVLQGGSVYSYDLVGYTLVKREWPLMQYTGLKDKNGTEIYEGDVVSVKGARFCEVVFHELAGCWDLKLINVLNNSPSGAVSPALWRYHTEVIGNIHEHKHLLEG